MPKVELSDAKRNRIYERDEYQCWYCGKQLEKPVGITNVNSLFVPKLELVPTIDHLEARVTGGYDTDENLVTACRGCNSRKGKKTVEEYRAYLAAKQDRHVGALKHLTAAISEAVEPYDQELRRIAAWMQGETVTVTFWGERKRTEKAA